MAFLEEKPNQLNPIIRWGIFIIAALAGKFAVSAAFAAYYKSDTYLGSQFDEMENRPPAAMLFQVLKKDYPEEYGSFRSKIISVASQGGSNFDVKSAAHDEVRALITRHKGGIASAPEPELGHLRQVQMKLIGQLSSESATACAQYVMGGIPASTQLSSAGYAVLSDLGVAQVEAAHAAELKPVTRPKEISSADAQALGSAMREAGATQAQIETLASPNGMAKIGADQQCEIGSLLSRALATLPDEQADRLFSAFFAAS